VTNPLVSVLIPVYNGERFLGEALDSVSGQGYEPLEVIVLDDGSTDGTAEIAAARDVRYVHQPHSGLPAARNAALAAAKGELITFLDSDDLWPAGNLDRLVRYLREHPETDLVLGRADVLVEPDKPPPPWFSRAWLSEPQHGLLQAMLARRRVFDLVGTFDTDFDMGDDADWLTRAKDAGARADFIQDVCAHYRLHDGQMTRLRRGEIAPALLRTMRASVHRQAASEEPEAG
jgi:glycosyltransferase involved in cell wall biosynthesis